MDFMKVFDQTVREIKRGQSQGLEGSRNRTKVSCSTECQMIMNVLWTRLGETGKGWSLVDEALTVIEYLVANGSDRAVDDVIDRTSIPDFSEGYFHIQLKLTMLVCLYRARYVGFSSSAIKSSSALFGSSSNFQNRDGYGGGGSGMTDEDSYDCYKKEQSQKDSYTKSHRGGKNDYQCSTLKELQSSFYRINRVLAVNNVDGESLASSNPRQKEGFQVKSGIWADSLSWTD
uniref:ENTH domain-containing protein n=1 Tax=Populus alba TaxID=43335 RepID=A0A4U5N710_POPAL|nr:hypothetical protein D5086_0000282790 [Populus alba]